MASKPIVAGTDGSEESLRAVDWAAREAALRGAPLRIVATAGLLPRMRPHTEAGRYETVADGLVDGRDRALALAAARAAKGAAGRPIGAGERQGPLHAIRAWHAPQAELTRAGPVPTESRAEAAADAATALAGLLDECRAKYPDVPVSHEVVHGHPARALTGLSARADLVVIGR